MWIEMMARITYAEACNQNWPRPTCAHCYVPMAFRPHTEICVSCLRDEFNQYITVRKREAICLPQSVKP